MDSEIKFYLDRYRKEEDGLAEAERQRIDWGAKESRCRENIKALLQLLVARAEETKDPLPGDLVGQAMAILGPQVKDRVKVSDESPSKAALKPVNFGSLDDYSANRQDGDGSDSLSTVVPFHPDGNRVDWIAATVAASGNNGITPPEIMRKAAAAGLTMHKNYPYVVLGKLVERKAVRKDEGRYYKGK